MTPPKGGVDVEFDTDQLERFLRLAPGVQKRVARNYFQKGGELVRAQQVKQAQERFGKEQTESRMQTRDPSRPRGSWAASIRSRIQASGKEQHTGPEVPHRWWVEDGSNAPADKIPESHRDARFIGHSPVEHATEDAEPVLRTLFEDELEDGIAWAAQRAGGRG